MTSPTDAVLYLDSSVAVHVLERAAPAVAWFGARIRRPGALTSSRVLALEVTRYLVRRGTPDHAAADLVRSVGHLPVDDRLLHEAAAVPTPLKSLDCLHLATAARLATERVVVVTHDRALARAARAMGLETTDPLAG